VRSNQRTHIPEPDEHRFAPPSFGERGETDQSWLLEKQCANRVRPLFGVAEQLLA
jgi:hypothetical protein